MNRRSFLGGMLAAAVAAVARVSPLVASAPRALHFRGIPIKVENPLTATEVLRRQEEMWYRGPSGPLSVAEVRDIVERMTAKLQGLPHKPGKVCFYARPDSRLLLEDAAQATREANLDAEALQDLQGG